MAIIEVRNLDFAYNGEEILRNVNLSIQEKCFVAITGPVGGGKTPLLKLLLGILAPPSRGTSYRRKISLRGFTMHRLCAAECRYNSEHFYHRVLEVVLMEQIDPKRSVILQSEANRWDAFERICVGGNTNQNHHNSSKGDQNG